MSLLQPSSRFEELHDALSILMLVTALPTFLALLLGITAPYGRYSRGGWGPMVAPKLAWFTQEIPSLLVTAFFCYKAGGFTLGPHRSTRTLLTCLFLAHYTYRSLVYPLLMRTKNATPFSVWLMSFVFCIWNGVLQGWFLGYQLDSRAPITPRVLAGAALQLLGLCSVIHADTTLIFLRKPGETGYKIPHGGMFRFVSAGNYASEILEWAGYSIAAWSLPAAAFAVFVFANLAPRGAQHHQWYQSKFDNYDRLGRRAVIPFIW